MSITYLFQGLNVWGIVQISATENVQLSKSCAQDVFKNVFMILWRIISRDFV